MLIYYLSIISSDADKSKFETMYLAYRDLMYHIANQILGDTKDSEDVVHQAFLKVIEIINKIEEAKCPKTRSLLVTIVERKAIDVYRSRQRRTVLPFDEEYINVPTTDELDNLNGVSAFAKAMVSLPTKYRELLLLKYDSGFSEREIAKLMTMREANVHKTIQRAKAKLSTLLSEMEAESSEYI